MANRYLLPHLPTAGRSDVTGDLAHHLGRVLRARPGDQIRLGDGRGHTADATVVRADKHSLTIEVSAPTYQPAVEPRVTVAFACPRPARTDWLIEHGSEVGVSVFQPLWTERSRPQGARLDRWRKIARAAAGQCDRAWSPEVREPSELTGWLASAGLPERRLLADAGGEILAPAGAAAAALLIGPEGGFTDGERTAALAAGFVAVRVGAHILRTETAALVSAAVLLAGAR